MRLFKRKNSGKPKSKEGRSPSKSTKAAQKVFGFEKVDREKYRKSPDLDDDEVISTLAKLETDLNWVKRILWLVVAGSGASHFID